MDTPPVYDPALDPEVIALKQKYATRIRKALIVLIIFALLLLTATAYLLLSSTFKFTD